jgi:hypothetical protein
MTEIEKRISGILRERALHEVDSRGFSDADLAKLLDVFPDGARRLRHNQEWSVGTGLTVLEKMGLTVEVNVGKP